MNKYMLSLLGLICTSSLFIQTSRCEVTQKQTTIVVIDGDTIGASSQAGKTLQNDLHKENTKATQEIEKFTAQLEKLEKRGQAVDEEYRKVQEELEKKKDLLHDDAKKKLEKKLSDLEKELQEIIGEMQQIQQIRIQTAQALEEKIQNSIKEQTNKFQNMVKETVDQLAKKHGWDIVIPNPLYATAHVDVTSQVIAAMDEKVKKQAPKKTEKAHHAEKAAA